MEKHIITDLKKGQIDLFLLWRVLQGNIIKIVILAVLLGGAVGLYRYTNAEPYYTAKIKFLVSGVSAEYDNGKLVGVYANIGAASMVVVTSQATRPDRAAVPSLSSAIPTATPMANRIAIWSMIEEAALIIRAETMLLAPQPTGSIQ